MATTPFITDAEATQKIQQSYNQLETQLDAIAGGSQGAIAIADTPTEIGYYYPTESGTYTNAGGLVVDLTDGITILIYDGTNWGMQVVPVDLAGYVNLEVGKNLFNKEAASVNLISNTGETIVNPDRHHSEYIPIIPSQAYISNYNMRFTTYYDSDKNWIPGGNSANGKTFTTPSDAAFVIVSMYSIDLDVFQLEKGTVYTGFEEYQKAVPLSKLNLNQIGVGLEGKLNVDGSDIKDTSIEFKKLKGISNENLFDVSKNIAPNIIEGKNYNTNGILVNNNSFNVSYKIEVSENTTYTVKNSFNPNYEVMGAAFDGNDNLLEPINFSHTPDPNGQTYASFTTPEGTSYIRLNLNSTQGQDGGSAILSYGEGDPGMYRPYGASLDWLNIPPTGNQWQGKKFSIMGDSITWGYTPSGDANDPTGTKITDNFSKLTASALGMQFENLGISSSVISVKETDPTSKNPMVLRYADMALDSDLIMVAGGTNDWNHSWTDLGDFTSRSNNDFYGALHNLCVGLIERYPTGKILFLTPIKRRTDLDAVNSFGRTLEEYADAIIKVCSYYGIPVLDCFREVAINPSIQTQYDLLITDGVHPNKLGHTIMAERLTNYLKQL